MKKKFNFNTKMSAIVFVAIFILSFVLFPTMVGAVKALLTAVLCVAFYVFCANVLPIEEEVGSGKIFVAFLVTYVATTAIYILMDTSSLAELKTYIKPLFVLIPLFAAVRCMPAGNRGDAYKSSAGRRHACFHNILSYR